MAEAQFKDIMMQPKLELSVNPNRLIQNIPHQPDVVVDKPAPFIETVPIPAPKIREESLPRKRGRPKKEKEDLPKRPRGRPCKNPVDWTEYILPSFAHIIPKREPDAPGSSTALQPAPLPVPLPRPKIKLHLSDDKKSNESVALNFVNRLLGIRRPRGRPRLHPQRDPSLPKRPRGRPRHDDPNNPIHRVVSQARIDAETQLMNLVANAMRSKTPKEEPQTEASFSGFPLNLSRESDADKQSDNEMNGNEDSADVNDFYPQIEYLE
uniref:Uncharacterized protein n=1 Tax=Bursaphelenchus xylophilus TaxID=6326 RepID=A0A1I7SRZ4_BURXY